MNSETIPQLDLPVYDSDQSPPPWIEEICQIFRYRDLLVQLVRRDLVMRYKRSVLGVAWTMLNPLGMMLILILVFSQVFGTARGYATYLLTGLLAWNFFAQSTNLAMRHLVSGGALMHRIYLPRTIFAATAVGTGLVNLLLSFIPLAVVMVVSGIRFSTAAFSLVVILPLLIVFTFGVALFASTLAAFFPDFAEVYEIGLSAWFYLTPVIYPEEIIPESIRYWVFGFNPMYYLIKLFRLALYEGKWPDPATLGMAAFLSGAILLAGWFTFTKKADDLLYRI